MSGEELRVEDDAQGESTLWRDERARCQVYELHKPVKAPANGSKK